MSTEPGCRIQWDVAVEGIKSRTDDLIVKARSVCDSIAALTNPSWDEVAKKLALFEADYGTERNAIDSMQHVSPDKELRQASCNAARKFSDVEVELE
ncbi:unnamed protein product [Echinostoma caproni]|uniref:Tektin n=1 Tax=Echinostoma caproni TaxID=27848 RepID=A0A183A0R7_9TREM|nr:unnamed protein product [Echinostoma caproni]